MIKKLTALALAALICLCVSSCAPSDDAPDGMKSVTVSGEPFVLFVPEAWTDNTASGISGAFVAAYDSLSVSARYHTPEDPNTTLDEYVTACIESVSLGFADRGYELTEQSTSTLLGGADAKRFTYKITNNDSKIICFQISARNGDDFVSLYGYCPEALYESYSADLDKIRTEFRFVQRPTDTGAEVVLKDTPEGMKLASDEDIEYRFYVPKSWVCDSQSGASEAYYSESGRPNVTVTSYAPDTTMTIDEYFLSCEEEYKKTVPAYERLGEPLERTVSGRLAYSYTYSATVEGVQIKIMQTILTYNGTVYSITYTALADRFDAHVADVEAMLGAFTLR